MSDANALLISQAGLLRRLWEVEKISLCLPPTDDSGAVLAHGQAEPAIPELADPEAVKGVLETIGRSGRKPVVRFDSARAGGHLFRITRLLGSERSNTTAPDFYSAAFLAVTFWIGVEPRPGQGPPDLAALSVADGPSPRVLDFTAELVWFCRRADAVMRDPVTSLPGRADFQSSLTRAVRRSRRNERPMALLLVNPDDLIHVNRRFGRPAGDAVIREIAARLEEATGHSDRVHRYGGAVFALTLEDAPSAVVRIVADKLHERLGSASYLDGDLRLGFCIGVAELDPAQIGGSTEVAQELVRRADAALGDAKRTEAGPVVFWGADTVADPRRRHDRLAGIFTADQSKDYRNMLLLWDMVRLVAESPDLESLARRAVGHLASTFEPQRVGFFAFHEGEARVLGGITRQRPGVFGGDRFAATAAEAALLEQARQRGQREEGSLAGGGCTLVVPVVAGDSVLGALLLALGADDPELDASDRVFLDALGGQLAAALDRIHLVERERRRQAEERRRLEAEVRELRDARRRAELVHRSPQMAELLDVVRRVAPTDVTVLVSGESGSGKEVVARLVHEMSPRRTRQPIVVDCGAIAASLIDSELFGYERGAYTGAERRSLGRLTEADGGTLILDEIGELPLEVQSKLLRFVQEKQLTPVGATRPRTVDVRLIAVTHRNLAAEVAAGRFRGDLYHRLNVVHLRVPPLAQRPDDVAALTEHFLERFAERYRKPIEGLTAEAEERVRAYPWPGNVRELENRLLRAVILCERRRIGLEELGLADHQSGMLAAERIHAAMTATPAPGLPASLPPSPPPPPPPPPSSPPLSAPSPPVPPAPDGGALDGLSTEGAWLGLGQELRRQLASAAGVRPPMGSWLAHDLLLVADSAAEGVASRGATLLGMPETTYRRRLRQAQEAAATRSPQWQTVQTSLARLLGHGYGGVDVLGRARRVLLEAVVEAHGHDLSAAAALMDVSAPTFRRWRREMEEGGSGPRAADP